MASSRPSMASSRPPNAKPAATPALPPCAPCSSSLPASSTSPASTFTPPSPHKIQQSLNLNNALGPFEGLGLTYGCKFAGTAEFMFPIFDMGTFNTDAAKVLDAQFETPLDLPDTVVVEVKFEDGWYRWPSGVILPLAYMIARRIILDKINIKYDFYHHREYI